MCNWEDGDACSSKFSAAHTLTICASIAWRKPRKLWLGSTTCLRGGSMALSRPRPFLTALHSSHGTGARLLLRGNGYGSPVFHLALQFASTVSESMPDTPRGRTALARSGRRVPDQCQIEANCGNIGQSPEPNNKHSDKLSDWAAGLRCQGIGASLRVCELSDAAVAS